MLKLAFFLFLIFPLSLMAGHLEAGLDSYQKGDLEASRLEFKELLKNPSFRFSALYNLGNIAAKQKKPGEALAYYRRAQDLNPRDKDLNYNIKLVTQENKILPAPGSISPLEIFKQEFLDLFTFQELALVGFIVTLLFLMTLFKFLKNRIEKEEKLFPPPSLLIWAGTFIIMTSLCIFKLIDTFTARGTIIAQKVPLRSGPRESNAALMELPEGTEVFIKDSASDNTVQWKQVTVPGNLTGWVLDKDIMQTSGEGPW